MTDQSGSSAAGSSAAGSSVSGAAASDPTPAGPSQPDRPDRTTRQNRLKRPGLVSAPDVVDVFVYVVVLNLAVQFLPAVITETFTMSLFTAVLLKIVLEVVLVIKKRVRHRFRSATTRVGKVGAGLLLWALLVGSKFVVLELIAFVFQGSVSLGGFVSVTLLIIALLLARAGVRRLLADPGAGTS